MYMVSELQTLCSQLPHSQTADTMATTPWWHLTCTCLAGALTKGALTRHVLRSLLTYQLHSHQPASGQVSPMSAVTVDFMLRGDMKNGSRTFQGEQTSQETQRKLPAASSDKGRPTLLRFCRRHCGSCQLSALHRHQASRALEASMPPALKSNLSSTQNQPVW